MREVVAGLFLDTFGRTPEVIVRAPGRVNLIGDHTDYNDGFVLPMALDLAVWVAAAPRRDREVSVFSAELGAARFDLDDLRRTGTFIDYFSGVAWRLGSSLKSGFDIAVVSDLPVGAGLSSSAACEMATLRSFSHLANDDWDPTKAAITARQIENEWIGVASGIMDQLIIGVARAGFATMIDCRSLDTLEFPIPGGVEVVVLDSGTRRQLASSAYNDRREACERVAVALGVGRLRDADLGMLDDVQVAPEDRRRARHVITENARVLATASALHKGDVEAAGRLMDESHQSLKDDFEVSTADLDRLVAIARQHPACLGARLTGAGMGGCAVALVQAEGAVEFGETVSNRYGTGTNRASAVYRSPPANGVDVIWSA